MKNNKLLMFILVLISINIYASSLEKSYGLNKKPSIIKQSTKDTKLFRTLSNMPLKSINTQKENINKIMEVDNSSNKWKNTIDLGENKYKYKATLDNVTIELNTNSKMLKLDPNPVEPTLHEEPDYNIKFNYKLK